MSTTEVELNTIHYCVNQFLYMKKLFNSLGFKSNGPPTLYNNNQLALVIIKSSQTNFHSMKKHYDIKLKRMIEIIKSGVLHIEYLLSNIMITDLLMKALGPTKLLKLVE